MDESEHHEAVEAGEDGARDTPAQQPPRAIATSRLQFCIPRMAGSWRR
jgi:hypothetical protein